MEINNRIAQYTAGIFFLLACYCLWFSPHHYGSHWAPPRIKVSAGTTNESTSTGHQVRKINLEISVFTHLF